VKKTDNNKQQNKLDERNHVEKPFLDQLYGLGREIIDLDSQHRATTTTRRLPEES
jgi:type I restriction enzyme R subunit